MAILTMQQNEALGMIMDRMRRGELPLDATFRLIGETLWVDIREDGEPLGITLKLNELGRWHASLNTETFVKSGV